MFVSSHLHNSEEDQQQKQEERAAAYRFHEQLVEQEHSQLQHDYHHHRLPSAADPATSSPSLTNNNNDNKKSVTMAIDMIPSVWLWLADDESWERFDRQETSVIAKALAKGHKGAILERGSTSYFLDLLRLTQTNACSGRRRPIYNVEKGASWQVQTKTPKGGEAWESFSIKETHQLEDAFFGGSDFAVLQRDDGTSCYVDLAKWTLTCLSSNETSYIKIIPTTNSDKNNSTMSSSSSSSGKTTSSPQQQQHKTLVVRHDSEASERTTATTPADDEDDSPSLSHEDTEEAPEQVPAAPSRRSYKCRASWKWHNDSSSWSSYDDDITEAIEKSWATGASDMVFERDHTQYYIDLQKLTQTNIDTGRVRSIQRISARKKSNSY